MPRVVDHQQRRDELVAVVWQLIVSDGLPGITIRRVAERSGWSSGAVRHYLPNREAILDAAAGRVAEVIEQRVRAVPPAAQPPSAQPREALIAVLEAVLPTDEVMVLASRVWLAFVGQAASDKSLADAQGIVYRDLNRLLVELLQWAEATGHRVSGGPATAAAQLQALVDGLTVHLLLGQLSADRADEVVRDAVSAVVADHG